MPDLTARMPTPRIGVVGTGYHYYWDQFPGLYEMCTNMYQRLCSRLEEIGELITIGRLVDDAAAAQEAAQQLHQEDVDLLLIFPATYTPGMQIVPVVRAVDVPVRIIAAHQDTSWDYANADETIFLFHEGVCCVPEYAGALVSQGIPFRVITGHFGQQHLWEQIASDCRGAAAARRFRELKFGVIGQTYTNMTDMPFDEHRLLRATGRLLERPEIEEIVQAYHRVSEAQLQQMYEQFREMYEVDETVTNEHMRFSAQAAVAYDEVITRHDISAFGYYWWGKEEVVTQLRAQSALAVSRLAALGRPGVTEGDVKTAMAMKILDLLGAGGMFVEFFAMDFDDNFVLMGHDGPANINMAAARPRLQHLQVHHGKSGYGLGIDFEIAEGPVTLVNLTQFNAGDTFKLIYTVGEVIPGEILQIGNPNCRVRLPLPLPAFFDAWCQQGPAHHSALGLGDQSREIEAFAEAMHFECVRIGPSDGP